MRVYFLQGIWLALICFGSNAPTQAADYHVAVTGTPYGNGSLAAPWTLQTALLGGLNSTGVPRIIPGDTVWLHGGTYHGAFVSRLQGGELAPIIVRQAPGERAIIDCSTARRDIDPQFIVAGEHTVFWGFEVTCSNARRDTGRSGSWPSEIRRGGITCRASNVKFINLVIHDLGTGIGGSSQSQPGEVYGCLIYNNGWKGPDRGHGHAIYMQNQHGTLRIADNIIFNQFGYGIHCHGSDKAHLAGFAIEGNVSFNNGCLSSPDRRSPAIFVGGGTPVERLRIENNLTYAGPVHCGYLWGSTNKDLLLANNYIVGDLLLRDFRPLTVTENTLVSEGTHVRLISSDTLDTSDFNWDRNSFFQTGSDSALVSITEGETTRSLPWDQWRETAGLDGTSILQRGRPTGTKIFVRPNQYEPGRGHIVVYNWDHQSTVSVDLSSVLKKGQAFRVVSAQNFYADPLVRGTYQGDEVEIPFRPVAAVQPVGMPDYTLPVTEPEFAVWVVLGEPPDRLNFDRANGEAVGSNRRNTEPHR